MYGRVHTYAPVNISSARAEQMRPACFVSRSKIPHGGGQISSAIARKSICVLKEQQRRAYPLKSYAHFLLTTFIHSMRRWNESMPVYACAHSCERAAVQTGTG